MDHQIVAQALEKSGLFAVRKLANNRFYINVRVTFPRGTALRAFKKAAGGGYIISREPYYWTMTAQELENELPTIREHVTDEVVQQKMDLVLFALSVKNWPMEDDLADIALKELLQTHQELDQLNAIPRVKK